MSVKWWIGITQSLACSYRVVHWYVYLPNLVLHSQHLPNLRSGPCGSSRDYFSLVWTSQLGAAGWCVVRFLGEATCSEGWRPFGAWTKCFLGGLLCLGAWRGCKTHHAEAHSMIPDLGKIANLESSFAFFDTLHTLPSIIFHLTT